MPDRSDMARRIARRMVDGDGRSKAAGEVRFVTDRPGDDQRQIGDSDDFEYDSAGLEELTRTLFKLSCALGQLDSAHSDFTKIKAVSVSPDGKLGGRGYVKPITEIRKTMTNCIEEVSSIVDTIDDEIRTNPHWQEDSPAVSETERSQVDEVVDEAEDIRDNPDDFAEGEYEQEVLDE